jgi:predicted Ser/Thr protein kinase
MTMSTVSTEMESWAAALETLGISSAVQLHESPWGPARRTYLHDGKLYKICLKHGGARLDAKAGNLSHEIAIVRRCAGLPGIRRALDYHCDDALEVAVYQYVDAISVKNRQLTFIQRCLILGRASVIVARLSWRGVAHNDLQLWNVLLADDGRLWIIDFDQASEVRRHEAFYRNFIKRVRKEHGFYGSWLRLAIRVLGPVLPGFFLRKLYAGLRYV